MKISIATPSFRNSKWLKLCIASVADQQGVEVEHIVHDAGSDDGTLDWLPHDPRVTAYVEKDNGMYDAINRAWKKSSGEIVAYLNCDEQYLPGALKAVHDYFELNPEIDAISADALIVDTNGQYICHRVGLTPLPNATWHRFNVLTCSLFIRRRVLDEKGLYFDTRWRDLGDVMWLLAALKAGVRFGELHYLTSVFTETGENMNLKENARREATLKREMTPLGVALLEPFYVLHHWARTALHPSAWKKPFTYELYTLDSPDRRVKREAKNPTPRWVGRN